MSVFGAMSGSLGGDLLVREVEEVDHPRGLEGHLAERLRGIDGKRFEEVAGISHRRAQSIVRAMPDVLVLCYHAVSERFPAPLSVTPAAFERQLELLARAGYQGATFADAVRAPAPKTVAITFDDAYLSVLELGKPILDAVGFPATVYAPTAYLDTPERPLAWAGIDNWIGGEHERELLPMSWDQLGGARGRRLGGRLAHAHAPAPDHARRRGVALGAGGVAGDGRTAPGARPARRWPTPTATTTSAWSPRPGPPATPPRARCRPACRARARSPGPGSGSTTATTSVAFG